MELVFFNTARNELANLSPDVQAVFLRHLQKIHARPSRIHMKPGIPCHVEKVTRTARIIYDINEDRTCILHCFASHNEYEHWYNSYR